MNRPFASIVIPTRERCDTLQFSLQTALNQSTDDYEIVVSDNFSNDDTRKVVTQLDDARIRYVNPGRRLSMRDNYEYALENARGDYVIYIGDDDGIMPDAISKLKSVFSDHPSPVYFWQTHMYRWPIEGKQARIEYIAPNVPPHQMDLRKLVRFSVGWGTWRYYALPCVYHSAVSRSLLDNIKARTGRVFHSTNPDVFMAFALPVFARHAIDAGISLTVNGTSAKSNGGSYVASGGAAVLDSFIREYGDYSLHRSLYPGVSFKMNMIPDSALVAMDLFPDFYKDMAFNYSAMWAFIQRLPSRDDGFSVLRARGKIRKYHHLSIARYLFSSAVHRTLFLRRLYLRNRLLSRRKSAPSDIAAFVRSLADDGHREPGLHE